MMIKMIPREAINCLYCICPWTPVVMSTSYQLLCNQFLTTYATPKFQVLDKMEVDIKSWIFPWIFPHVLPSETCLLDSSA